MIKVNRIADWLKYSPILDEEDDEGNITKVTSGIFDKNKYKHTMFVRKPKDALLIVNTADYFQVPIPINFWSYVSYDLYGTLKILLTEHKHKIHIFYVIKDILSTSIEDFEDFKIKYPNFLEVSLNYTKFKLPENMIRYIINNYTLFREYVKNELPNNYLYSFKIHIKNREMVKFIVNIIRTKIINLWVEFLFTVLNDVIRAGPDSKSLIPWVNKNISVLENNDIILHGMKFSDSLTAYDISVNFVKLISQYKDIEYFKYTPIEILVKFILSSNSIFTAEFKVDEWDGGLVYIFKKLISSYDSDYYLEDLIKIIFYDFNEPDFKEKYLLSQVTPDNINWYIIKIKVNNICYILDLLFKLVDNFEKYLIEFIPQWKGELKPTENFVDYIISTFKSWENREINYYPIALN